MTINEQLRSIKNRSSNVLELAPFSLLKDELSSALSLYGSTAARILRGSGVNLLDPPQDFFSLERIFFCALPALLSQSLHSQTPSKIFA